MKFLKELLNGIDRNMPPAAKARKLWEYYYEQGVIPSLSMEYANQRIKERGREMYDEAMGQMRASMSLKTQVPDFYKAAELETGKLSRYLYNRVQEGKSCFVYGQFVPEKTYAACAVLNELALYDGRRCLYVSAYDIAELGNITAKNTTDDLTKTDVLVIDELDKLDIYANGGKALSKLGEIIDKRRSKVTIFTSNLSYSGLAGVYAKKNIQLSSNVMSTIAQICGQEIEIKTDGSYADRNYVAA